MVSAHRAYMPTYDYTNGCSYSIYLFLKVIPGVYRSQHFGGLDPIPLPTLIRDLSYALWELFLRCGRWMFYIYVINPMNRCRFPESVKVLACFRRNERSCWMRLSGIWAATFNVTNPALSSTTGWHSHHGHHRSHRIHTCYHRLVWIIP